MVRLSKQERLWRLVSVASALIGLICYALSSSFNHLFGNWKPWKIIFYALFSSITFLVAVLAKDWKKSTTLRFIASKWQRLRIIRFRSVTTFLLMVSTTVFSFFSDRAAAEVAKPDAHSVVSSVAFSAMSLSLSRNVPFVFEELMYFFMGIFIAQMMKIKTLLGFSVGVVLSFCFVILHSRVDEVHDRTESVGIQDEQLQVAIDVASLKASGENHGITWVMQRVRQAAQRSGTRPESIRVVAVSKTKPVSMIREVYDAGHRCFGENYVQEIIEKASQLPQDIEWHFIGNLQSNKVKPLLSGVPNLAMLEGVDNQKVANHLDRMVSTLGRNPLKVLVQVNTSGEESKYGIDPSNCVDLAKHVKLSCPNLVFSGLMTVGGPDYTSTPENFKTLSNCRTEVCKTLEMPEEQCELSMGMSGDFELAIEMGSTNVRIGSTIFGPRVYSMKQE